MSDQHDDDSQQPEEESEDLLATIEQVEETLSVMTSVVSNLRDQLRERLEEGDPQHLSAEEYLKQLDNPGGVWH